MMVCERFGKVKRMQVTLVDIEAHAGRQLGNKSWVEEQRVRRRNEWSWRPGSPLEATHGRWRHRPAQAPSPPHQGRPTHSSIALAPLHPILFAMLAILTYR